MPTFNYTAIDAATGKRRSGSIESRAAEPAAAELRASGLYPVLLEPKPAKAKNVAVPGAPGSMSGRRRLSIGRAATAREQAVFTRQLAVLLTAGVPLVRGIDLLARQERNPRWQAVLSGLADAIRAGGTLGDGLARHPNLFDRLYRGMVRAGESTGALDLVLDRLARHLEKAERTRTRVRAAMTYPLVIMVVAMGVVAALVVFVVPRFEAIFASLLHGAPLPLLTQGVLAACRLIGHHGFLLLGVVLLAAWGGRRLQRTPSGARLADAVLRRLPLFGALRLKAGVARFSRSLGAMLASGVPILDALQLTQEACSSPAMAGAIDRVRIAVREGRGLGVPMEATGVFPPVAAGMVEVGEETGTLPAMLARLADLYEDEVDAAIGSLTSLIEPAMIVAMAVVVGTVVLALFLPIVRIIQMLG